MNRINLLPYREEKRRQAKQQFIALAAVSALLGVLIGFAGYQVMAMRVDAQQARNTELQTSINDLEKQIKQIENIKGEIDRLQRHKGVIENLQSTRGATVNLFNALATDMPEGMFLTRIEQRGNSVTLTGFSQSNARVSQLMNRIETSPYLASPVLVEIKRASYKDRPVSAFTLRISLVSEAPTQQEEAKK